MSLSSETILFSWRVSVIEANASEIEGYAHVFDRLGHWDTAMEKFDLRRSAQRLREAAAKIDNIADQIQGPATAFPDYQQAAE